MEDNIQESTRPLGPKPLPTRIIVNTDTGAADLYVDEGVFGRTKIAEGSAIGNNWAVNDEFVRRWNNRNGTNLTKDQLQKVFTRDLQSTVNYDRANIINKYSATNTKTYLSQTAKLPGIIDPRGGATPPGAKIAQPGPAPAAPPVGTPSLTKEQDKETTSAFTDVDARKEYSKDLRYPENLQLNHQDCIQFSVFEYNVRGLQLGLDKNRRKLTDSKLKNSKGTITFPIPAGIGDINAVDWQKDDLDLTQSGIGNLVIGGVSGGTAGATAAAKDVETTLSAAGQKTLTSIVAAKTAQAVIGSNVLSRAYGGVLNPNSELLFTGPQLRTFTFNFRLSPRSSKEAIMVKKIIRTFKQAMSVQRGKSSLILRTPNTFGIKYLTSNGEEHPYLTKFKECALTQCNVNYTPDGTYMTYAGEPSMTAYELQLTFQELEPIFNDDYGNDYDNVGY